MPTWSTTLTPDKFTAYLASLPAQGFTATATVPGNGTVTGMGVTINYQFTGTVLNLQGVSKPWYVSWGYIWGLIGEHLAPQG